MDIGTAQRSYTHSSRHAHEERGVRIRRPLSHLVGARGGTAVRPTTNLPQAVARGQAVRREPRAAVRWPLAVGRTYERFLELPQAFVLAVLWMVGAALLGSIALALYWTGWVLVQLAAGSI
jgi:hypothetical protein